MMAKESDSNPSDKYSTFASVSVLLVIAYFLLYYATLTQRNIVIGTGPTYYYSIAGLKVPNHAHSFFAPAHAIDRMVRGDRAGVD
jgi:hypothetical protein